MPTAQERMEALARELRQRQEKERQAAAAWKKALPKCQAIAAELARVFAGISISVEAAGEALTIELPNGAAAVFGFSRRSLSLEARRVPAGTDKGARGDVFFTLRIEPPAAATRNDSQWGPGQTEGIRDLTPTAGSQEAFEKAVADFLEWGLAGAGCGGEPVRLP